MRNNVLRVNGSQVVEVNINPVDVLKALREDEYDFMRDSLYEKDGKYFIERDRCANLIEIPKKKYHYLLALNTVISYLYEK